MQFNQWSYLRNMWFNKWTFLRINWTNEIECWAFEQPLFHIPIEHTDLDAVPNMFHLQTSNKTTSVRSGHQSSHVDFSKSNGAQGISIEDSFNSPYFDSVDESLSRMQDNYNNALSIATATHVKPSLLIPFNQDNLANMTTVTHPHLMWEYHKWIFQCGDNSV